MHINSADDYLEMMKRWTHLTEQERLWLVELNLLMDKGFSEDEEKAYDLAMTKLEATFNHKEKL